MSRKKVAYLASEYPGISHTFIFREIQSLRAVGFDVKTASIRRPANLEKMTGKEKADARQTLYIKDTALTKVGMAHLHILLKSPLQYLRMLKDALSLARRGPGSLVLGLAYFAEAGILLSWLLKNGTRHVHVHFANPAATVAMIASVYGTMEFSMSVHGPDIFYNVDTGLLKEKVCRAVFVRCISYYSRSQLMRLVDHDMWDKFHIVRCGIDPEVFAPRPVPQNDIPEILCVGRLVPAKGQHVLLDACSILNKQGVPFHLTYVGDGDDRLSLEKLTGGLGLGDRVTFTGAVGQDDVHQYYDRADLFVLASFAEGVPVVLMEAMAKQIACISTRITGIPELIEDGTDGALAAPSDAEDLAARLELLLEDGSLRHDLGRKGREKVLAHYDLAANCRIMARVFDMYLGSEKK